MERVFNLKLLDMKPNELEHNKIYFIAYGENTQLLFRFKDNNDSMRINTYDEIHYWNGHETFRQNGYMVTSGITELRKASKPEKYHLIGLEIEHNLI